MQFLKQIETLFRTGTAGGLTDGQLLERFLERRDELAEAAARNLAESASSAKKRSIAAVSPARSPGSTSRPCAFNLFSTSLTGS